MEGRVWNLEEKLEKIAKTQEQILHKLNILFGNAPGHSTPRGHTTPPVSPYSPFINVPQFMPQQPVRLTDRDQQYNSLSEQNSITGTESIPSQSEPLPIHTLFKNSHLPSSDIAKELLQPVGEVLGKIINSNGEIEEEKAGTVGQILARKSIFGEDFMKQCTPGGSKDLPVLPLAELFELKSIVFRHIAGKKCPQKFELIWKTKCWVDIEQACRRLRRK